MTAASPLLQSSLAADACSRYFYLYFKTRCMLCKNGSEGSHYGFEGGARRNTSLCKQCTSDQWHIEATVSPAPTSPYRQSWGLEDSMLTQIRLANSTCMINHVLDVHRCVTQVALLILDAKNIPVYSRWCQTRALAGTQTSKSMRLIWQGMWPTWPVCITINLKKRILIPCQEQGRCLFRQAFCYDKICSLCRQSD